MDTQGSDFPEVERIDPVRIPGTMNVGYVVVAKGNQPPFEASHVRTIEQTLQSRLARTTTVRIKRGEAGGHASLAIQVEPADSMTGTGSYPVLGILQGLFKPSVPYAAIAIVQSRWQVHGTFFIDIKVLGNPGNSVLDELSARILEIPQTVSIRPDEEEDRNLVITVLGSWSEITLGYQKALIAQAGISSHMLHSPIPRYGV